MRIKQKQTKSVILHNGGKLEYNFRYSLTNGSLPLLWLFMLLLFVNVQILLFENILVLVLFTHNT